MKRSMKSALVGTFATDSAVLFVTVLTGSLAARLLLPEGRGALAATLFWPQLLAGLGWLSLSDAATYRIGVQPDRAPVVTASALWLALALASLTMFCGYLLLPLLLGQERAHLVPLARGYLLAFVPFNFVALGLLASDHGNLHFGRYNILRLLVSLVYLVCLLALWATDRASVGWVAAANCAGTVLVTLLLVKVHGSKLLLAPSREEIKALAGLAGRFHPTSVLLFLAAQVDQFVVLTLWDDATLGKYVVAVTVAGSGFAVVGSAFHKVLFPHLVWVREARAQAELLARGVRCATMLLVALSVPIAMVMPWLVHWLFGAAFAEVVRPAWALLVGYLLVALKGILIQGFRGLGEGRPGAVAAAINIVLILLLAWPLGDAWDLVGVATAVGVANMAALVYLARRLQRRGDLQLRDFWGLTPRTLGEVWNSRWALNPFLARTT